MLKARLKLAIWLLLLVLGLAAAWSTISAVGDLIASFQRGSDPAAAPRPASSRPSLASRLARRIIRGHSIEPDTPRPRTDSPTVATKGAGTR